MYDETIAAHYAAYRPPLHAIILEQALVRDRKRRVGLDLGCGTGYSAYALASFCDLVVGVEPGKSMLDSARPYDNVNYVNAYAEQMPFPPQSMDVVTLAGSLNYINVKPLIAELVRVCRADSEILIYDFEVILIGFENNLGLDLGGFTQEYDHSANLGGFIEFDEIVVIEKQLLIEASPLQVAHLLLSDSSRHKAICDKYRNSNPLRLIESDIEAMAITTGIKADIYYSLYALS